MTEFVKQFHQVAVLIPDLEDRVAYTSLLNSLKNGQFKFSLAEQKETILAKVLRKAAKFFRAIKFCVESTNTSKKAMVPANGNVGRGDRMPRLDIRDSYIMADPRSMLMEVKGHPMLRKP